MGKNIFIKTAFWMPVLFLSVFFFYPLLLVFLKVLDINAVSLENNFFFAGRYFWNSFVQAIFSTLLSFLIGFPAAYLVARNDFFGKNFLKSISLVPFVFPSILVVLFFVILFGYNGVLNRALMGFFGLSEPPIQVLYGFYGIILAHAFYNFPVFLRIIGNSWESLEGKMEVTAKTLGANNFQVFFMITLPQLLPSIIAAASIVFIYSFMSFAIVLTLGGAGFSTIETGIFYAINRQLDFSGAALLALIQFGFLFFVLVLLNRFSKNFVEQEFEGKKSKAGVVSKVFALMLGITIAVPVLALILFSVSTQNGFSLSVIEEIFSGKNTLTGDTALGSIFNSLFFALIAAFFSVLFGLMLSFSLQRKNNWLIEGLVISSLAVSGVMLGFGYILGFSSNFFWFIPLGHAVIAFPFAYKIISHALNKISRETVFAATVSGASPLKNFLLIQLPQIKGAVASAASFSFAISLGELGLVMLLSQGKFATMTVYIQRFLSVYNIQAACAMGLILIFFSGISFYVIEKTIGKSGVKWI